MLRAAERLTKIQRTRLVSALDTADPNDDILAAWVAKELLPDVLGYTATGALRYEIRAALHSSYTFCAATSVPEIHNLAKPSNLTTTNNSRDHHRPVQHRQ